MTLGDNNFNDFPENQQTKFQLGVKNVTILHTFAALFQYSMSTAKKRDIWRPGKTETWDNEAKIRDVPGNTDRLATLNLAVDLTTLIYRLQLDIMHVFICDSLSVKGTLIKRIFSDM